MSGWPAVKVWVARSNVAVPPEPAPVGFFTTKQWVAETGAATARASVVKPSKMRTFRQLISLDIDCSFRVQDGTIVRKASCG